MQCRAVGTCTGDALVAQGHEHGQGNRLETGKKYHPPAQHGDAVAEQVEGQQRLRAAPFMANEKRQAKHRAGEQRQYGWRCPGVALADQGNAQQQATQANNQQHGAEVIDLGLAALDRHVAQCPMDRPQRDHSQWQVDPEHPAPGQVLGQPAAEHRPGDAGHCVHAAEIALVTAPFARWHEVADDRLADRHHAPCTDPLQHTGQHQLLHVLGEGAGNRRQGEQRDAGKDHPPPAIQVTQFAVDRHRHRHRYHVPGDHPGQQADIVELCGNGRQRDGDNGLVQRAEEDGQHQSGEHVAQDGRGQGGSHEITLGMAMRPMKCNLT
ncbi:hypothetical protein D3C76_800580 [compost metagenome]